MITEGQHIASFMILLLSWGKFQKFPWSDVDLLVSHGLDFVSKYPLMGRFCFNEPPDLIIGRIWRYNSRSCAHHVCFSCLSQGHFWLGNFKPPCHSRAIFLWGFIGTKFTLEATSRNWHHLWVILVFSSKFPSIHLIKLGVEIFSTRSESCTKLGRNTMDVIVEL